MTAVAMMAALLAFSSPASAATTGTITLHSRTCPAGQPTTDIFTDCHSHLPVVTTSYSIDGGAAQTVGADGNLSITGLAAGAHTIAQVDGVPLDFAHLRAFASDVTVGGAVAELAVNVNTFTVSAVAGDEIVVDIYTIPENASGLTPTAVPSSGNGTSLPNTGVGANAGSGNPGLELALVVLAIVGVGAAALHRNTRG
jgi:hypothetical protein